MRIYVYYISNFNNNKLKHVINKKFLQIILDNKYLGTVFFDGIVFYNSPKKNIEIACIKLPDSDIEQLKELKQSLNIPNILLGH